MSDRTANTMSASALLIVAVFAIGWVYTAVHGNIEARRFAEQQQQMAQQEQAEFEALQGREIAACEKYGLVAIDIERGHSPKCLNFSTNLMTVPKELYEVRGGHM